MFFNKCGVTVMKKLLCILVSFIFFFVLACSPDKNLANNESGRSDVTDSETNSEQNEIIDFGTNYRIYKGNITQVRYEIYNTKGETVLSETTDRPLKINTINDNLIDIAIGMGTGITVHKYYSISNDIFSSEFTYVYSNLDELIAYIYVPTENPMENRKVIIQNIFDKSLFYKEFELDFSKVDTPIMEATFSRDGKSLQITYLTGEAQTEISKTLYW